jgi:hypothetical protein
MISSIDIYHFGWSEDELAVYRKQYQSKYYGSANDARFEILDNEGVLYYAIFRTAADNEWVTKSKDYLLFEDQNRVLLNIGGKLYRYLIKEKKVLNTYCYDNKIASNDFGKSISLNFHSIIPSNHKIIVVVDCEGIAAINWDNVLWKHKFEWSDCGHLELLSADDTHVIAEYEDCSKGKLYYISFNLQDGKYEIKKKRAGY